MKGSKIAVQRKPYEGPKVVFKSALEAYAQVCNGVPSEVKEFDDGTWCTKIQLS